MTTTTSAVAASMSKDRLLDVVMYLASLVSEPRAIRAIMNPVREVTAGLTPGATLSAADEQTLKRARAELEQYLITSEPLRAFTPEVLQQRVDDYLHGARRRSLYTILGGAAVITAVLIAVVMTAPLPLPMSSRGLIAPSIITMMVHLTAAALCIVALKGFSPSLQKSYQLIAAGIIILGISRISQPIINILGLQHSVYNTILAVLPLIPSYLLLYFGMRAFARLINRQSRWLEPPTLLAVMTITVVVAVLLPHGTSPAPENLLDFALVLQAVNLSLVGFLIALTIRTARAVTSLYARPVRLLVAFSVISALIGIYVLIVNLTTGGVPSAVLLIPLIASTIINGFILLRAGYDFNRSSLR